MTVQEYNAALIAYIKAVKETYPTARAVTIDLLRPFPTPFKYFAQETAVAKISTEDPKLIYPGKVQFIYG